jgi:hypothetical protein
MTSSTSIGRDLAALAALRVAAAQAIERARQTDSALPREILRQLDEAAVEHGERHAVDVVARRLVLDRLNPMAVETARRRIRRIRQCGRTGYTVRGQKPA